MKMKTHKNIQPSVVGPWYALKHLNKARSIIYNSNPPTTHTHHENPFISPDTQVQKYNVIEYYI